MEPQLQSIDFSNFRTFRETRLELDSQVTVLVANNGHGKTSALDGIALCLAQLLGTKQSKKKLDRLELRASDARTSYAMPPYTASSFPVSIAATDTSGASWGGQLTSAEGNPAWEIPRNLGSLISPKTLNTGSATNMPVFAYYSTNRTQSNVVQNKPPALGQLDRSFGYHNALRAGDSLSELGPWLAQSEWERTNRGTSVWNAALQAVYEAGAKVLRPHGVTRVSYSMESKDVLLDFGRLHENESTGLIEPLEEGSAVVPMLLASDGFRSILGLVSDLAFRCGVLNHHLGGEAAQLTSGIVLIDEIDMHLHPAWQTHILTDLMETFPLIQFVVTTHSPFILSSTDGQHVRGIDQIKGSSTFRQVTNLPLGSSIELITEELLNAPTRAKTDYSTTLSELARALDARDLDLASTHAAQLMEFPSSLDGEGTGLLAELRWRMAKEQEE